MENIKLAVIGLGYVGLPLARLFATRYPVVGYDVKRERVAALMEGRDATQEVSDELLRSVLLPRLPEEGEAGLFCTSDAEQLRGCNYYIVAVPTPVDLHHSPDLTPLYSASETVGKVLGRGDIVIYESTVCPGITEDECVPILERTSGLVFNRDFFAGYSPERINPGRQGTYGGEDYESNIRFHSRSRREGRCPIPIGYPGWNLSGIQYQSGGGCQSDRKLPA